MDRLCHIASRSRLTSFQISRRGAKSAILTRLTEDKKDAVRVKAPISDEEDRKSSLKVTGNKEEEYGETLDDEQTASNAASKVLLEELRVYNRHIEQTPSWLKDLQVKVCDNRTSAQVSRLIKPWMIKTDIDYITHYRSQPLGWQIPSPPAGTIGKKDPQRFVYGPEEAAAYTAVHLPPRQAITKRLLSEHRNRHPHFEPRRVLDFGCGPGTASLAVMETWPELRGDMDITALDPSRAMLDAAQIILLRGRNPSVKTNNNKGRGNVPSFIFISRSLDIVQKVLRSHPQTHQNTIQNVSTQSEQAVNSNGRYDLILCNFVLGELQSDEQRQAAVQLLYELLDVNGILLILEPGHVMGSHIVRTSRQQVLTMSQSMDKKGHFQNFHCIDTVKPKAQQKQTKLKTDPNESITFGQMLLPPVQPRSNHTDVKGTILAPCTHDDVCPLGIAQRCAFTQRVAGSGLGAVIHKDSEAKFAYVVVAKQLRANSTSSQSSSSQSGNSKLKPIDHIDRYINTITTSDDKAEDSNKESSSELTEEDSEESRLLLSMTPASLLEAALDPNMKNPIGKLLRSRAADSALWESYFNNQPEWIREEWARIIKPPLKKDGHVILDICTSNGTLQRVTQARTALNRALPGLFTMLRKSSSGGLLPSPLVRRGNAMRINSYQLGLMDAANDSHDDSDDDEERNASGKKKKIGSRGRASRQQQQAEQEQEEQVVLPSGRGFLSEEDEDSDKLEQANSIKEAKSRSQQNRTTSGGRERGRRRR